MRVTQSMLASNSLSYLSKSYEKLGMYQDQLSSGKKITKPSQDPVVAMKGVQYRSNLNDIQQYKRNLSEVYLWMDNSEAGIEQTNNALQRVRELLIQGKNGTLSEDDKQAIGEEIGQLKESVMGIANTQVGGRYIFNGTSVDQPPVTEGNPPVSTINTDPYEVQVSPGVKLQASVNGENVFSSEMFQTLQNIEDTLNGAEDLDMDELLSDLDGNIETMSAERSELGARYNRLEMIETRIDQQEVMSSRVLSENEDIDIERVITDLKTQESVHRAALGVGARIIQPTLLDFLR
ncbi:flagellar hook-associated protein FlgL [Bacillus fonticola]|uniref:flagellar hook-associated protein FlgL n=1 Tax=Bacillus fonticola TaxID=2728853 RepID=UPI001472C8B4|nr:flagellar hook-associated protein FlgL [Bacillus fonticola]